MEIKLSLETVNQIISVLAQLPNSSGTFGLMMQIKETAEQQYKSQQTLTEEA